jgi:hypothetical protein
MLEQPEQYRLQPVSQHSTDSNIQIQTSIQIEGARRNQTGIFGANSRNTDAQHVTAAVLAPIAVDVTNQS